MKTWPGGAIPALQDCLEHPVWHNFQEAESNFKVAPPWRNTWHAVKSYTSRCFDDMTPRPSPHALIRSCGLLQGCKGASPEAPTSEQVTRIFKSNYYFNIISAIVRILIALQYIYYPWVISSGRRLQKYNWEQLWWCCFFIWAFLWSIYEIITFNTWLS